MDIMVHKESVRIPVNGVFLSGNLSIPSHAEGVVIFSHGSGSSRLSPRNNYVADVLNHLNIATLLVDLLSPEEDSIYENRFNIDLLTERLVAVTEYARLINDLKNLKTGYFGASTGAASALKAASKSSSYIDAIVSRGGRPDLAKPILKYVKAPVLLIVGGLDIEVLQLNQEAFNQLNCKKELFIVPGATHLFEEPGKLSEVAELAAGWFKKYLVKSKS